MLCLVREIAVINRITKPTRIIVTSQMEHPCRLADTLGDLGKNGKVLGPEIMSAVWPTEVEAVVTQVALGVLSMMADAFGAAGLRLHREGQLAIANEPRNQP